MLRLIPVLLLSLCIGKEMQAQCNAAFSVITYGSTGQFHAHDSLTNKTHTWDFGDGQQGWGKLVYHNYLSPGAYIVRHYITDSVNNCRDTAQQTVNISFAATCTASFVISRDSVLQHAFRFSSSSSTSSGSIIGYKWTLNGDSVANTPVFDTSLSGTKYYVCLSILTSSGCTSTTCDSIRTDSSRIDSGTHCNLAPSFNATPAVSNPLQISFSPVPSGPAYSYSWNLGDGQTSNLPSPVHTYAIPGNYLVTLYVADSSASCRDSVKQYVYLPGTPDDSLLNKQAVQKISSFPNPAYSTPVTVQLDLPQSEKIKLTVYNSFGNLVYSSEKAYTAGNNRISIPVDKLQRGMYYVDIRYGNNRKQSTFQKL